MRDPKQISPQRKQLYYAGMAVSAVGLLLFLSVFVSGALNLARRLWFLRTNWRHSSERFSLAAFAALRLCENRRPNKEAHFSQSRKAAKAQRRKGADAADNREGFIPQCI